MSRSEEITMDEVLATFRTAVPSARAEVEEVALMFAQNEVSPPRRWNSYKPFFEMVFYLAWLDYILKVQVLKMIEDPQNRLVHESNLVLTLDEAIEKIPVAASYAYNCLREKPTGAPLGIDQYREAQEGYRQTLKDIKADTEFRSVLKQIRNGVGAHHGFDKGKGAEQLVAWCLASAELPSDETPLGSQVLMFAVQVGRAVQEFGARLNALSAK